MLFECLKISMGSLAKLRGGPDFGPRLPGFKSSSGTFYLWGRQQRCSPSQPQFPHLYNGCNNPHFLGLLGQFGEMVPGNHIASCLCMRAKSLQSCPTLCNPMDCSPPGSSVQGILQARILEWVSMLSSRVSSQPGDRTCISCVSCIDRQVLYHWHHLGSP